MALSDEQVEELALAPAKVVSDGQEIEERPVADLLAIQNRQAAKVGATKRHRGLYLTKLIPNGSVSP